MNYLSVCSGIEAASTAWHPLGWNPIAFAEIEKFPSAVLAHRYPHVPNLGDMTQYQQWPTYESTPINLIVGGTPCQAFSFAGLRQGLSDPRGNLTLTFLGLVDRYRPKWVVWENVPGVLSDRTNAFGQFLAGLGQLGYGWAYRMLDAQYFGVAQRRKRMFVVGCLGDWPGAAAVLFEPACLLGNPAPSRETRQGIAPTLAARTKGGGGLGTDFDCDGGCIAIQEPGKRTGRSTNDIRCGLGLGSASDPMFTLQAGAVHGVAHTLKASGFDASEDGTGRGTPIVPVWPALVPPTLDAHFGEKQGLENQHINGGAGLFVADALRCRRPGEGGISGDTTHIVPVVSPALNTQSGSHHAPDTKAYIAFSCKDSGNDAGDLSPTLRAMGGKEPNGGGQVAVAIGFQDDTTPKATEERIGAIRANAGGEGACVQRGMSVRRLTPTECERLQGFPDGYTDIPWRKKQTSPDGPRYKALGNSMAVPCMAWIGKRIAAVDSLTQ